MLALVRVAVATPFHAPPARRWPVARAVSLELACRNHGKDPGVILDEIRRAMEG